ncbi:hypothetical protein ACWD0Z_14610 [Streptomyces sp. NPDC003007]
MTGIAVRASPRRDSAAHGIKVDTLDPFNEPNPNSWRRISAPSRHRPVAWARRATSQQVSGWDVPG